MRIRCSARTDVGRVRDGNEDRLHADEERLLFAVADGVGGELAGERAAERFVHTVRNAGNRFAALPGDDAPSQELQDAGLRLLAQVFSEASHAVYEEAQSDPSARGMATTGVLVWLCRGKAFVGHVGDSRVYLLRDGQATLLTTDHTVGQALLAQGVLKPEQIERMVYSGVLARAVGQLPNVQSDTVCIDLQSGDRLLLCTDGLHRYIDGDDLVGKSDGGVDGLIDTALEAGGADNVTAIVLDVVESADTGADLPTAERVRVLEQHFLFRYLTFQELLRTMKIVREQRFEAGDTVVREGDPGDRIYSVVQGQLAVVKDGVTLTELGPGAGFGEIAFSDARPRSADVVARSEATLLSIQRDDFERLTREDSAIAWKLLWCFVLNLSDRLRALSEDFVTGGSQS